MSLKSTFCPRCGKALAEPSSAGPSRNPISAREAKLVDGLCPDCYVDKTKATLPKPVSIRVCKKCRAVEVLGIWTLTDEKPEHYLTEMLVPKLKLPENALLGGIKITEVGKNGKVRVDFTVKDKKFSQDVTADVEINKTICPNCSMRLGKTHQAVVQVRSDSIAIGFSERILRFAERYKTNIIKTEDQKRGIDIYMSSKDAARHMAAELRKMFKFKIKESHEHYGWNSLKGQPKTRLSILLFKK